MPSYATIPGLTDRSMSIRGGLGATGAAFQHGNPSGAGFSDTLAQAIGGERTARAEIGGSQESHASEARRSAEEFVSIAFIQPVLTQLRETNNAAAPFAPGDSERMFGGLWDAEIAQRITSSQQFELVNIVARQLLRQSQPGAESAPRPAGASAHG